MSCDDFQRIFIATSTFLTIVLFFISGPIIITLLVNLKFMERVFSEAREDCSSCEGSHEGYTCPKKHCSMVMLHANGAGLLAPIVGNIYIKIICSIYIVYYILECIYKVTDRGGRRACQCVRNWGLWKWFLGYFPVDLVKTVDLPPDRNYLVCIFPHGWLSIGGFLNFASNHSKWSALFPGIRPRFTTLAMNYYLPIYRELLLSLGMSSVNAKSLIAILHDKSNRDGYTASAAGLIVGGEREQRQSAVDTYKFVLKTRKGFARIALKTGASLVPAISFGENNTFEVKGWKVRFNGRVPITTVVGAPIHTDENLCPSEEEVDEVHQQFCKQIRELFEEHKSKYVENSGQVELEFV